MKELLREAESERKYAKYACLYFYHTNMGEDNPFVLNNWYVLGYTSDLDAAIEIHRIWARELAYRENEYLMIKTAKEMEVFLKSLKKLERKTEQILARARSFVLGAA